MCVGRRNPTRANSRCPPGALLGYPDAAVTDPAKPTILCIASFFKGNRFLARCKQDGWNVVLMTAESLMHEPWARESIDEIFAMPTFTDRKAVLNAVAYLARTREFHRISPLDDYDVELVALLREHIRVPGMGETTARYFRDKLAMRARAFDRGIKVPPFVHVLNHDKVRRFLAEVPGPWVLKPRAEASSSGIKKLSNPDDVWKAIEEFGDTQSNYLIEKMIPGDVYHVDGIISERNLVFAEVHKYRKPMLELVQQGGIFCTRTIPRDSDDARALRTFNQEVMAQFGLMRGVCHSEYIKGRDDGAFYFLETSARVGGASIADLVEATTGINLWEEWARIETTQGESPYTLPPVRADYGGLIVSLARQEHPDTSAYVDPEIVWRLDKKNHVGFVVRAGTPERVLELIDALMPRIQTDFQATLPQPLKPTA